MEDNIFTLNPVYHAEDICLTGGAGGDGTIKINNHESINLTNQTITFQPVEDKYIKLKNVLLEAASQASNGKGHIRHADDDESYEDQLVCEMDRRLNGRAIGPRYQAIKKIYESARLNKEAAIQELYGAINYLAAAIILLKED